MFSLICAWMKAWVNNGEADDLRRHRAHYDINIMIRSYDIDCVRKVDSQHSWWRTSTTFAFSVLYIDRMLSLYIPGRRRGLPHRLCCIIVEMQKCFYVFFNKFNGTMIKTFTWHILHRPWCLKFEMEWNIAYMSWLRHCVPKPTIHHLKKHRQWHRIAWASWRLKLIKANNKQTIKALHHWRFVLGITSTEDQKCEKCVHAMTPSCL